jgi:ATP-binding cassette, subfamily A (ABC1), member 1
MSQQQLKMNSVSLNKNNSQEKEIDSMDTIELEEASRRLEAQRSIANSEHDKRIDEFIKSRLQHAILVQKMGNELTYSISNKSEHTLAYEQFFAELETNMIKLGIENVGMSDTTLEEVFIKLAKQPRRNTFKRSLPNASLINAFGIEKKWTSLKALLKNKISFCSKLSCNSQAVETDSEQLKLFSSYTKLRVNSSLLAVGQQLYALLIKRFQRSKRNLKGFVAEIVLPIVFVCLALVVATLQPKVTDLPLLELHPWYYDKPNKIFMSMSSTHASESAFFSSASNPIVRTFFDKTSLGL